MNVYECNGTNIFMRWKMKCSIQRGEAKLNGTFYLSPNENICSTAQMRKHSLFVLYNLYKDSNLLNKFKWKSVEKMTLAPAKHHVNKPRVQLYAGNITRMIASRLMYTLHLLHLPRVEFCRYPFLLASFLDQTSEDCIGNTNVRRLYWKYWTLLSNCERWVQ